MDSGNFSTTFLIPVMSQTIAPFLSKLGSELQERGYEVTYIPQNKTHILRTTKDKLDEGSLVFSHITSTPESSFEDLLDKYNIQSPRSTVFPQMVYDYEYTNVDHQPFVSGAKRPNYEPYFDLLYRALDTFDRLFENDKGGVPIQKQGAEILRRALQRVAKAQDVQTVWTGFSPLDNHIGLFEDESVDWETFEPDYDVSMTDEEREAARAFVTRVRNQQEVVGESRTGSWFNPWETARRTSGRTCRLLNPEYDSKEMVDRWVSHNARKVSKRIKAGIATKLYLNSEHSKRIIKEKQYVFFPLQYARESRVTVRAPPYYDLPWIIEYLSRSLPYGYELVVKDHPHQVGALPIDAMRAIARHSSALDPQTNAHQIIQNCDAVVTLNNTVGYEALIHGKPVVTLGSAFYDGAGYSYSPENINDIPEVLQEAIKSDGLEKQEVYTFSHRIIKGSYPGLWNDISDENISHVVNSILSFCNND